MTRWPSRLGLVRHGESLGNVANADAYRTQALQLDVASSDPAIELSARGRTQAAALGRSLTTVLGWVPTLVVVSPYARTRETAELILDAASLAGVPQLLDERVRDREQGILDRLTRWGVREQYPQEAERREYLGKFWYRPPGGESWADVAVRLRGCIADLRADDAERVLIVTHDVPILVARYILEGLAVEDTVKLSGQVANCSVTAYRGDGARLAPEFFNRVLSGEVTT